MKKIVLIGAGGHCKVIIDIIRSMGEYEIVGITDNGSDEALLNIPVIGDDNILEQLFREGVKYAFVCVGGLGNMELRTNIYNMLQEVGFQLPILIHKSAIISSYANIGEGTCVMPGAIINPDSTIGRNCIINTGSIIEHDCIIGDNTHISPKVVIAGKVIVGCNTHIGMGSSIIQGKNIGNNVTIGAGAVVVSNIEDNLVAVGVPAKVIRVKS